VSDRRVLESLQRVTDAALAYLSEDALLTEILHRVSEILQTDTTAILLLEPSGDMLRARAAKGIEEEVEQGVRIPVGRGFAGRIAAERRPISIEDVDHADILNPILRQKGIRSLLGAPLMIEGRVLGVLHVGTLTPRRFTSEDADLLQLAADRVAIAIEQAQVNRRRQVAEALQRTLLPESMPAVPGLELAVRYLPAAGTSLGGDWFDAFQLPTGRIALTVGDVVGHGLTAAAAMAQLRTALRAYAIEGHEPGAVVERVNRLMWRLGPVAMTTLVYVVLDAAEESLELVNAGHPPPLIVDPTTGEGAFLPLQGGVALGAAPAATYRAERFPFPPGGLVVLYTDGVVERRGAPIDDGMEKLRRLTEGCEDVERVCSLVLQRMVPEAPPDDVAVVAARLPPLGDELFTRWPAHAEALVGVRQMLRRWLHDRGAGADEAFDIVVACQEACTNAVEHAFGPGRGWFEVAATCTDRRVQVTVRDHGRWRQPRSGERGRGLPLMQALMHEVHVDRSRTGTTVTLERTLEGGG
jgi:serine phosphatase RsbU (regulator of sigma subunit)/anti-sigma regulatory factor (Ser/Thr protein kinase)